MSNLIEVLWLQFDSMVDYKRIYIVWGDAPAPMQKDQLVSLDSYNNHNCA
ncbi:MAG: hypothetical protein OSA05_03925 [Nitrospinaceae bacterium]|nr:hypothetical protein [Nitrospinaceae bacterium]